MIAMNNLLSHKFKPDDNEQLCHQGNLLQKFLLVLKLSSIFCNNTSYENSLLRYQTKDIHVLLPC